jgi:hypothetical protein
MDVSAGYGADVPGTIKAENGKRNSCNSKRLSLFFLLHARR